MAVAACKRLVLKYDKEAPGDSLFGANLPDQLFVVLLEGNAAFICFDCISA